MSLFSVLYSELSNELISCKGNVNLITDFIKSKSPSLSNEEMDLVKKTIQKQFLGHFTKRWKESHNNRSQFIRKNEKWLKSTFKILF